MPLTLIHKHKSTRKAMARGFTLVELMISMLIGTIVIAGALSAYVTNTKASSDILGMTHLNQELRTIMEIIGGDLRNAGYWAGAQSSLALDTNPFGITAVSSSPNCILFSHDINNNSTLDNAEYRGYRLNQSTVETRPGNLSCATTNAWTTMSNKDKVLITDLTFIENKACRDINRPTQPSCTTPTPSSGDSLITSRSIDIELVGQLKIDPSIHLVLNQTILINNDSVSIQP